MQFLNAEAGVSQSRLAEGKPSRAKLNDGDVRVFEENSTGAKGDKCWRQHKIKRIKNPAC